MFHYLVITDWPYEPTTIEGVFDHLVSAMTHVEAGDFAHNYRFGAIEIQCWRGGIHIETYEAVTIKPLRFKKTVHVEIAEPENRTPPHTENNEPDTREQ